MAILDTVTKTNEYANHGVHVLRSFLKENDFSIINTWLETTSENVVNVSGDLTAKSYEIAAPRASIRPIILKLREAVKAKYECDSLHTNLFRVLEISPWEWEELAFPDYEPTPEELAEWDKPMKPASFDDPAKREESGAQLNASSYLEASVEDKSVLNRVFSPGDGNEVNSVAYHAMVVLDSEFDGGAVTLDSALSGEKITINLSAGDVLVFRRDVCSDQVISKINSGKMLCFNIIMTHLLGPL